MTFDDLQLIPPLLSAVHTEGYHQPTPIQVQAIPHILAGRDLLGCAQTGTGKTAAFGIPFVQALIDPAADVKNGHPQALVLGPTRELALRLRFKGLVPAYRPGDGRVPFGDRTMQMYVQMPRAEVSGQLWVAGRVLDVVGIGYMVWLAWRLSQAAQLAKVDPRRQKHA